VDERAPASSAFEIEVVSASRARRGVTSLMSLLSFTSGSATLPQWRRYEVRDRKSGAVLRTVNDDVNGRDVEAELRRDLQELNAADFAARWKLGE
jgi:hypothetical protein